MAGSNQANRLQGMLSDLAGSFSMENMGGAGMAYTKNIRDYMAPELDAEDPESLRRYAQYSARNGDPSTAAKYQLAASELGKEQRTRDAGIQMVKMQTTLREMEGQRQAAIAAAPDQASIKAINGNFDSAAQTLANRMNEFAVTSDIGGAGNEGTEMLENDIQNMKKESAGIRAAVSIARNNPDMVHLVPAIEEGAIDPQTFFQSVTSGGQKIHSAKLYKNGVRSLLYANGDTVAVGPDGARYEGDVAAQMLTEAADYEANLTSDASWNTGRNELVLEQAADIESKLQSVDNLDSQLARADAILVADPTLDLGGLNDALPALSDSRRQFDALKTEMAIDLAGLANMGILSDSDVQNLRQSAIPSGSNQSMRDFITERRQALAKVKGVATDMAAWMYKNRGTRSEYYAQLAEKNAREDERDQSFGVRMTDQNTAPVAGQSERVDLGNGVSFTVRGQ